MIVGITGFKGSGKSTVANVFTQHGYAYKPFAGPLKTMLMALLLNAETPQEVAVRALYGDLKEVPMEAFGGRTSRHAMQTLGTEWGRDLISPTLWTDTWKRSIGHKALVVTDDVRFPNELDIIHNTGGVVLRVERAGLEAKDAHISEQHIASMTVDGVINNNGDIGNLMRNANEYAAQLAVAGERQEDDPPHIH